MYDCESSSGTGTLVGTYVYAENESTSSYGVTFNSSLGRKFGWFSTTEKINFGSYKYIDFRIGMQRGKWQLDNESPGSGFGFYLRVAVADGMDTNLFSSSYNKYAGDLFITNATYGYFNLTITNYSGSGYLKWGGYMNVDANRCTEAICTKHARLQKTNSSFDSDANGYTNYTTWSD